VVAQGVAGVRAAGGSDAIRPGDPFVIGSCGKAITATLAARLVEAGRIQFGSTLEAVFPDLRATMRREYRTVTLEALLAHRSGLPDWPPGVSVGSGGTPSEQRRRLLPLALLLPPVGKPLRDYRYSSVGYAVAGAMLERVTGEAFESLTQKRVFGPLGMGSAGFFAPTGTAPRGHTASGQPVAASSSLYPPRAGSPAGLYHVNVADWVRFARVHLGLGPAGFLSSSTLSRLQRPWPGGGERYALGWHVRSRSFGTELSHNGSDGLWSAQATLVPGKDHAILLATNILNARAADAADALRDSLRTRFPPS
jgi:CubicO group peptidase (beta-lactamase class C family)